MDRRLARRIHAVARLDHVAHQDGVDGIGRDARALDGGAHGGGAQFDGGDGFQGSVERADGGPDGGTQDDIAGRHDDSLRWMDGGLHYTAMHK